MHKEARVAGQVGQVRPDAILAFLAALLSLLAVLGADTFVGIAVFNEQKILVVFGLCLAAVYVRYRYNSSRDSSCVPWYDWAAAVISIMVSGYCAINYRLLIETLYQTPVDAVLCSFVIIVLLIEALRRAAGLPLAILVGAFILLGLVAFLLPGDFEGRRIAPSRLISYLGLDSNALVGLPLAISTSVVMAFLLFGAMLKAIKGDEFFTRVSTLLVGSRRGGAGKIAVLASMLFGTVSGSAVASVATTGSITIPLMKKSGMPARQAGAIEAVASTGGQLMPPMMGAAAFIMAEFLSIPFHAVAYAALFPSVLYYFATYMMIDAMAYRNNVPGLPVDKNWAFLDVLRQAALFFGPLLVLIFFLFGLRWRPDNAAVMATVVLIVAYLVLNVRKLPASLLNVPRALAQVGLDLLPIIMIAAAAGLIIGVLNITGLGFAFTLFFANVGSAGGLPLLLLLAAGVSIILGMGMPTLGVYLLLAALVAPSITEFGVPAIAAHLFCLYFGILSLISPPVAISSYTAAGIAEAPAMATAFEGLKVGWLAFLVPFMFVYSPELLGQGSWFEVFRAVASVMIAIVFVSCGIVGFHRTRLSPFARLAYLVVGALIILNPILLLKTPLVNIASGWIAPVAAVYLAYRWAISPPDSSTQAR